MPEILRSSFPARLFTPVALVLSLLASANMVAAQSAPPPAPRQIIAAPPPAPPAAAAPAPLAPPAAQGVPGAYAQPPLAAPPPGAYPESAQQPGAYPQQQSYPQQQTYPPPAGYQQQPPPGYVAYPNSQPLYQPSGPVPFRPRRASKGMMIAGISILGGSYLLAMSIGVGLLSDSDQYDSDNCDSSCLAVGRWLFVPVAGPFVAMSHTDSGDWALWMLGMVELVGAGLMTGGIIKYRNSKRANDMQGYSWNLPHDRKLTVDMASSARFMGPRLRLDF
jgi:hypothetical protein